MAEFHFRHCLSVQREELIGEYEKTVGDEIRNTRQWLCICFYGGIK